MKGSKAFHERATASHTGSHRPHSKTSGTGIEGVFAVHVQLIVLRVLELSEEFQQFDHLSWNCRTATPIIPTILVKRLELVFKRANRLHFYDIL